MRTSMVAGDTIPQNIDAYRTLWERKAVPDVRETTEFIRFAVPGEEV
jgi:hypothetical protein